MDCGTRPASRLTKAGAFENILPEAASTNYYEVNTAFEDSRGRIWLGPRGEGLFFTGSAECFTDAFCGPGQDDHLVGRRRQARAHLVWNGFRPLRAGLRSNKGAHSISAHEAHVVFIDLVAAQSGRAPTAKGCSATGMARSPGCERWTACRTTLSGLWRRIGKAISGLERGMV